MQLLKPKRHLSVVIPTGDDDTRLSLALDGYCVQTYSDFEVHVVDDGGPGTAADVVDRYRPRLDIHYHRLVAPGRYHPASARNVGISNSSAVRTVLSDCDVVPSPVVMERHASYGAEPVYVVGLRRRISRVVTESIIMPQHEAGVLDATSISKYPWKDDQRLKEPQFREPFRHMVAGEEPSPEVLARFAAYFGVLPSQMRGGLWRAWLCWSFNASFPGTSLRFNPAFDCNYGYEDLEFALRVISSGNRVAVDSSVVAYHLDHMPRAPEDGKQNRIFLDTLSAVLRGV